MIREKSYFISLSETVEDRLRVRVLLERGKVRAFTVQYEAFLLDGWRAIVRYDTAHQFAHKDTLHPGGETEKQPIYFPNFNLALSFAIMDLRNTWGWYRSAYQLELEREKKRRG